MNKNKGMKMKQSRLILVALFALGLAVIWVGFSFFAGMNGAYSPSEWLVLSVILVNYCLFFLDVPILFGGAASFGSRIPFLGISLGMQLPYAALSIFSVLLFCLKAWPFSISLVIQGALLFVLLAGAFLSQLAGEKVREVAQKEGSIRGELDKLKSLMPRVIALAQSDPEVAGLLPRLNDCAERLRYLSPVDSDEARSLEASMSSILLALRTLMESRNGQSVPGIRAGEAQRLIDTLSLDLNQRKTLRN